jgi:hypothetical protein
VSHFVCPLCLAPWVPADALRHRSDTPSPVENLPPTELRCPPCEVAFERALWDAFPDSVSRSAAYREAERITVLQRRMHRQGLQGG